MDVGLVQIYDDICGVSLGSPFALPKFLSVQIGEDALEGSEKNSWAQYLEDGSEVAIEQRSPEQSAWHRLCLVESGFDFPLLRHEHLKWNKLAGYNFIADNEGIQIRSLFLFKGSEPFVVVQRRPKISFETYDFLVSIGYLQEMVSQNGGSTSDQFYGMMDFVEITED